MTFLPNKSLVLILKREYKAKWNIKKDKKPYWLSFLKGRPYRGMFYEVKKKVFCCCLYAYYFHCFSCPSLIVQCSLGIP